MKVNYYFGTRRYNSMIDFFHKKFYLLSEYMKRIQNLKRSSPMRFTVCPFFMGALKEPLAYALVLYAHFCSVVLIKSHISFKSSPHFRTIRLFFFSSPKFSASTAVLFSTIQSFLLCGPNENAYIL